MFGAHSLIANSGTDSHNAIMASDVNGTGLQGLDLSSIILPRLHTRTCFGAAAVANGLL